jgi:hypothetical protein
MINQNFKENKPLVETNIDKIFELYLAGFLLVVYNGAQIKRRHQNGKESFKRHDYC